VVASSSVAASRHHAAVALDIVGVLSAHRGRSVMPVRSSPPSSAALDGRVTGSSRHRRAGTIDARSHLDFKMIATLTNGLGGGLGAATAGVLNDVFGALSGGAARSSQSRGQRIPFLVQGTTSGPIFIPDVSGVSIRMLKD